MNYATSISPTDLRDYAKVRGWTPVPEAIVDRLYVLKSPKGQYRQLIVPMDVDSPDFDDALRVAIGELSQVEGRAFSLVEASLMESSSDTWSFGVTTMRPSEDGLPLSYAALAMKGIENAFRAAACSEVQRQPFHPRMKRVEAQRLVEAAQMRHTVNGSFVLKIGCPIDAISTEDSDGSASKLPFVRRAMLGMSDAVHQLITALETDTLDKLVEEARQDGRSPLSANLCEALAAFKYEELKANLDLSVAWSCRLESPAPVHLKKARIQWDYFPRIEEVGTALRPAQEAREQTFVGTVDELKGDPSPGPEREGEVILGLLIDTEIVKAKVNLSAAHHRIAFEAYGQGHALVQVTGRLNPGNQPRKLVNVTAFSIVPK
jgi:hypothetical protein